MRALLPPRAHRREQRRIPGSSSAGRPRPRLRIRPLASAGRCGEASWSGCSSFTQQQQQQQQQGAAAGPKPPSAPAAAAAAAEDHQAPCSADDEAFMAMALQQAQEAFDAGEVPVGAVMVGAGSRVLAAAANCTEARANPLCHAELVCIMRAAEAREAWRLSDATLYCTLEPCPMCAGAMLQARLRRVVYGARQPRLGADGSWVALLPPAPASSPQDAGTADGAPGGLAAAAGGGGAAPAASPSGPHPFHPDMQVTRGVLEGQCADLMVRFFRRRRQQQKDARAAATAGDGR